MHAAARAHLDSPWCVAASCCAFCAAASAERKLRSVAYRESGSTRAGAFGGAAWHAGNGGSGWREGGGRGHLQPALSLVRLERGAIAKPLLQLLHAQLHGMLRLAQLLLRGGREGAWPLWAVTGVGQAGGGDLLIASCVALALRLYDLAAQPRAILLRSLHFRAARRQQVLHLNHGNSRLRSEGASQDVGACATQGHGHGHGYGQCMWTCARCGRVSSECGRTSALLSSRPCTESTFRPSCSSSESRSARICRTARAAWGR